MDSPPIGCTLMSTAPASLRHVLERQPGIRQALVFGSVAAGTARADSDLDVAVEAEHPLSAVEKAQGVRCPAASAT